MTDQGMTIHRTGLPALQMFLNARLYLYANVYYHRTTRAIDLHLRDIFHDTMTYLFPHNPLDRMEEYLNLTDWSLIEAVRQWPKDRRKRVRALGQEWARILSRDIKWKMAFNTLLPTRGAEWGEHFMDRKTLETRIRHALPAHLKQVEFRVDLASQDPRPINLLNMGANVLATNDGIVRLTVDHFFSGKGIFVDHGLGLHSMYFHLSEISVVEGQLVRRGEVIGQVGASGRATGPHLHWGIRLNGARVDPYSLTTLPLDGTGPLASRSTEDSALRTER